jgi:hypothetical protein
MSAHRSLALVMLVVALGRGAAAIAAETGGEATVAAAYDSNVTRAQLRDDIRADSHVEATGTVTLRWPVGDADAATLGAGLRGAQYLRYERLSYAALEASAGWQRKLGLGLTAPWIAASALIAHEAYRETARDSDRLAVQLTVGQRFSERLDASLGYVYDRRYARHDDVLVPGISGAVWDLVGNSVFARAGYAATDRWQLQAGYAWRRGDVVATTHRGVAIFLASDAIAESDAFGAEFYDYRLRGTTQSADAGASYALGDHAALDFTYAYAHTSAAQGLHYQNHVIGAAWTYRY